VKRTFVLVTVVLAVAVPALLPASASGRASYATYLCAYGKHVPPLAGKVYFALSVSPKRVGPAFCRRFNATWHGTREPAGYQLGTGVPDCEYSKSNATASVVAAIFADRRRSGKAFCAVWHPSGWHRMR
jgi:hypothetical protein